MYKKIILLAAVLLVINSLSAQNINSDEYLTIFLVRHAEKVDSSQDPDLSEEGTLRALELAETLRNAEIDHVYSTDFIRTRNTAQPTVELFNLDIELYNPRELEDFAMNLKSKKGRFLVVGHSNTTPALVKLLGGKPGVPIVEKNEYDRLYILTCTEATVNTVLLRYGKKFHSNR